MKFTYIIILVILFGITACQRAKDSEVQKIKNKINNVNLNKGRESLILSCEKMEIINGGLPPYYYQEKYGETISSLVDDDIVFIVFEHGEKRIEVVSKSEFQLNVENPDNLILHHGDTLFVYYRNSGVAWKVGKVKK